MSDREPSEPSAEGSELDIALEQRGHLRRILFAFLVVVVLLPFAALGGAWSLLLIPLLLVGAFGLREALALRRSVQRHGVHRA